MAVRAALLGDAAIRCEVETLAEAHALFAAMQGLATPAVRNVVPGWRTVVVSFHEPGPDVAGLLERIESLRVEDLEPQVGRQHRLTVRYDGEDLDDVARISGLDVDEVVRRHVAATYTVAFLGFSPGFPYLAGLDPSIAVPRRPTARQRVDAGSVGIADDVTGVYPAESPGGWHIVGHVAERLFDPEASPPALLAPGDTVTFAPA